MGNKSNLIIISASNGKNLELSTNFQKKSQKLNISSEILDLTTLNIPLYNPRNHSNKDIPDEVNLIKEKLFAIDKWIICAPEYNGSIPPILSNLVAHGYLFQEMTSEIFLMGNLLQSRPFLEDQVSN